MTLKKHVFQITSLTASVLFVPLVVALELNVELEGSTAFSTQDDDRSGSVEVVSDNGVNTLKLVGNRWRRSAETFSVAAGTVLAFEYRSFHEGEIHGIGLDEDNELSSNRIFKLHGTQNWGVRDTVTYTGAGDFQSFEIPVGQFYTGQTMRVVFVNDNDVSNPTNNGEFRNVRVITPNDSPEPTDPASCELTNLEQALVDAHNALRAEGRTCGNEFYPAVPPLTWNCKLGQIAREHSTDMATHDFMSHTGSDGLSPFDRMRNVGYQYRWASENVAAGYRTVDAVMQGWLSSEGHCKNIMSSNVTEIGVSAAENSDSRFKMYWTGAFGNPR